MSITICRENGDVMRELTEIWAELNGRILGNIRFESDLCTRRLIGQSRLGVGASILGLLEYIVMVE